MNSLTKAVAAATAMLALPVVASAATTHMSTMNTGASTFSTTAGSGSPTSISGSKDPMIGGDHDTSLASMNAEHRYLEQVCPSVLSDPEGHSASLDRFCQENGG